MARKRERTFAAFGAILFLLTSSALTVAVVVSLLQSKSSNTNASTNQNNSSNMTKLQGTKLANFTPIASIPSLQAIDLKPGNGAAVKPGANVTVDYTGAV